MSFSALQDFIRVRRGRKDLTSTSCKNVRLYFADGTSQKIPVACYLYILETRETDLSMQYTYGVVEKIVRRSKNVSRVLLAGGVSVRVYTTPALQVGSFVKTIPVKVKQSKKDYVFYRTHAEVNYHREYKIIESVMARKLKNFRLPKHLTIQDLAMEYFKYLYKNNAFLRYQTRSYLIVATNNWIKNFIKSRVVKEVDVTRSLNDLVGDEGDQIEYIDRLQYSSASQDHMADCHMSNLETAEYLKFIREKLKKQDSIPALEGNGKNLKSITFSELFELLYEKETIDSIAKKIGYGVTAVRTVVKELHTYLKRVTETCYGYKELMAN